MKRNDSHLDDRTRRTMSRARIEAALSRLRSEKIEVTELSSGTYLVAGRFTFFPAAGNWHAIGGGKQGGEVASLIAAVKAS